jgi:ABC-type transporter Mla maintaining outer membrane lipid asymmetry ATPase subunit MlaF
MDKERLTLVCVCARVCVCVCEITGQVVMYDEPTAGLDPIASTVVEDLIRSLHGNRVASYVVVTHQHSTIRRAVDRLVFLHEGKVRMKNIPSLKSREG